MREWLGAMVSSGVIVHDPADASYHLPAAHAACLTRDSSENLAVIAQYIPVLAGVEEQVVNCFKNGGGVPYSAYPRFHQVMAEDSGQTVVAALAEHILPLAPGLTERLAGGIEVLDVGCGAGRAMNLLARAYPNSHFTGLDLSREAIDAASTEARRHGSGNVSFRVDDLSTLAPGSFDLITAFDAIHDQARPDRVLAGIASALRADGTFLMQDIRASSHVEANRDHPIGTLLYTLSCMHCMTVSLAQGGMGLGAVWGRELAGTMLGEAGFARVAVHELPHDIQNDYYVCHKG